MRIWPGPLAAAILTGLLAAAPAWADESPFCHVYTTDTLPAGAGARAMAHLEARPARPELDKLAGRSEYEYGVTNDLQLGGYLNYEWSRVHPQGAAAATTETKFYGVSAEAIYRLMGSLYPSARGGALFRARHRPRHAQAGVEASAAEELPGRPSGAGRQSRARVERSGSTGPGHWSKKTEFNMTWPGSTSPVGSLHAELVGRAGIRQPARVRRRFCTMADQQHRRQFSSWGRHPLCQRDYFVTLGVQRSCPGRRTERQPGDERRRFRP